MDELSEAECKNKIKELERIFYHYSSESSEISEELTSP